MGRLHRMLILTACPYQQILTSKGAETTNGTASQHIHINKYADLPDGSTIQIVDSGPLFTFLVIPKQQNGTRVLYEHGSKVDRSTFPHPSWNTTLLQLTKTPLNNIENYNQKTSTKVTTFPQGTGDQRGLTRWCAEERLHQTVSGYWATAPSLGSWR